MMASVQANVTQIKDGGVMMKNTNKLRVWDIGQYEGELVVVTEIDLSGTATVTRVNGSVTHIHQDFLKNHIKGNVSTEVAQKILEIWK